MTLRSPSASVLRGSLWAGISLTHLPAHRLPLPPADPMKGEHPSPPPLHPVLAFLRPLYAPFLQREAPAAEVVGAAAAEVEGVASGARVDLERQTPAHLASRKAVLSGGTACQALISGCANGCVVGCDNGCVVGCDNGCSGTGWCVDGVACQCVSLRDGLPNQPASLLLDQARSECAFGSPAASLSGKKEEGSRKQGACRPASPPCTSGKQEGGSRRSPGEQEAGSREQGAGQPASPPRSLPGAPVVTNSVELSRVYVDGFLCPRWRFAFAALVRSRGFEHTRPKPPHALRLSR